MEMDEQIKVVYDGDTFKIIKPLTVDALCKYDKDHYFCDGSIYSSRNFAKPNSVTYIFISKNSNMIETFRRLEDNVILDKNENDVPLSEVQKNLKDYMGVPKDMTRKLLGSNFFNLLRGFVRGDVSARGLGNSDPMIYEVRESLDGDPKIVLDFDDIDRFLEMIGLSDDDISFYNWVSSGRWEFRNYDSDYEDMREGYGPFWSFDQENLDKLEYISSFLMPGQKFEKNEGTFAELFRIMYDEFPRRMDDIIYPWTDAANEQMNDTAWKSVKEELDEFFKKVNLEVDLGKELVKMNPLQILSMYTEVGDTRMTLKELLEEYFQNKKTNLGGWYDDQYEYENQREWDMEGLNKKWSSDLDDIIEELNEESDKYGNIYKLHWKMKDKFGFRKVHQTPKDPNIWFQILRIDKGDGKILVQILKTKNKKKGDTFSRNESIKDINHKFTEENFNLFLNQPELFDIFNEK